MEWAAISYVQSGDAWTATSRVLPALDAINDVFTRYA